MDFALLRPLTPRGIGCRMAWLVLGSVFVLVGMAQSQTMGQEVDGVESSPKPPVTGHVLPPPQPLQTLKNPGPGLDGPGPGVLGNPSQLLVLPIFNATSPLSSHTAADDPSEIGVDCIPTPGSEREFEPNVEFGQMPDMGWGTLNRRPLPLDTKFVELAKDHPQFKIESFRHRAAGADQREVSVTWSQTSGPCMGITCAILRLADDPHFQYFVLDDLTRQSKNLIIFIFDKRDQPIADDFGAEMFLAVKHADTWYQVSEPVTSNCESKLQTRPPTEADSQVFREATLQMEKWRNDLVPIPADVELPLRTKVWDVVQAGHWYQEGFVAEMSPRGLVTVRCDPQDHRGTTPRGYQTTDYPTEFFILRDVLAELPKHEKSVEAAPK